MESPLRRFRFNYSTDTQFIIPKDRCTGKQKIGPLTIEGPYRRNTRFTKVLPSSQITNPFLDTTASSVVLKHTMYVLGFNKGL